MDGSAGNESNGGSEGQGQMKCHCPCLPTHPPLTSCCVAGFLTGHRGLETSGLSNQTLDHIVTLANYSTPLCIIKNEENGSVFLAGFVRIK